MIEWKQIITFSYEQNGDGKHVTINISVFKDDDTQGWQWDGHVYGKDGAFASISDIAPTEAEAKTLAEEWFNAHVHLLNGVKNVGSV